ncbi:glutaminase [Hymenobacter sp. UV11]
MADNISQLAKVNSDQFAVAICTVDGQRFAPSDSTATCAYGCNILT